MRRKLLRHREITNPHHRELLGLPFKLETSTRDSLISTDLLTAQTYPANGRQTRPAAPDRLPHQDATCSLF